MFAYRKANKYSTYINRKNIIYIFSIYKFEIIWQCNLIGLLTLIYRIHLLGRCEFTVNICSLLHLDQFLLAAYIHHFLTIKQIVFMLLAKKKASLWRPLSSVQYSRHTHIHIYKVNKDPLYCERNGVASRITFICTPRTHWLIKKAEKWVSIFKEREKERERRRGGGFVSNERYQIYISLLHTTFQTFTC